MSDQILMPRTPAGGFAAISKYNPHLWSAEQLRAIFVARRNELAELLHLMKTTEPDTVGQHVLLVGARGMGKSTLMQRLALAVEDDEDLKINWLPLRFPEEQYTVATLGQFWANVLDSLADVLEQRGEATTELDAAAQRIGGLPVADRAAAVLVAINDCAEARGQRLLLLVDNTDLLLHNIDQDAHWGLRETLQSNPRLLWVGGSYQSLEADSHYHDAFIDFFQTIELRPLRLDEMEQALLALAATFGGDQACETMQKQLDQHPERLPTLRRLSGGNPRTTVMLYELFANGQEGDVRGDLEALLDEMTPLYKGRMDALADTPRKLLAHILEHWAPIALGELARVSQIKKTSISPQLQRLELEGLIEKAPLHGTSRNGYQVAERFFNIWYLMRFSPRRQRARLAWLVEFMRLWFSNDELCTLARQRIAQYETASPSHHDWKYDRALADALPQEASERHALSWSLLKQIQSTRARLAEFFDLEGEESSFKDAADYLQRLDALPRLLRQCPHAKTEGEKDRWVEAVMGSVSLSLANKERVGSEAKELNRFQYDELLKVFLQETEKREKQLGTGAQALHSAVLSRDFFPDMPDSCLAYEQIRACFDGKPDALCFAVDLLFEKHKDVWVLRGLELLPQDARAAFRRGWLMQEYLGRYDEAEAAYRQAIALDNKYARPWNNLGNLLRDHLGRYEEAKAAYQQAIVLDDKYALAWNNLGTMLQDHPGCYDEAEAAYRQAIALDNKVAVPWFNLGNLLQLHLGRYKEAEAAYRQAIALDDKYNSPWVNLGTLLQAHLGRHEEAEAAYRQAIALDNKVAVPWFNLGNLLQLHLGRYKEAEAAYRHAIALDDKDATSWNSLGNLLQTHLGRYEDAEAAYRQATALDEKNAVPWSNLGSLLQDYLGRYEEAEKAYRQAIALDEKNAWPKANLARLLVRSAQREEATSLYRDVASLADNQALLLQSHLFLGNRQLALDALEGLVQQVQAGEQHAFYRIKEQLWECHQLGLGMRLADWMAESNATVFLLPFIQALYTLAGAKEKLQDLPLETQKMVDEIVRQGRSRQEGVCHP